MTSIVAKSEPGPELISYIDLIEVAKVEECASAAQERVQVFMSVMVNFENSKKL